MTRLVVLASVVVASLALAGKPRQVSPEELKMVEGSADYTKTLELVLKHRDDEKALISKVVALKLKPHPLGDEYVIAPVPMPPPGVKFEPGRMPDDWKGTWGEVAMVFWRGELSREQYEALHKAAHGKRPGFPNCK